MKAKTVSSIYPVTLCFGLLSSGCVLGPEYQRPDLEIPPVYRTAASASAGKSAGTSLGALGWWHLSTDSTLRGYLNEALTNSPDIQIAAARVLQAEAQLQTTNSSFFPNISTGGSLTTTRASQQGPGAGGIDPQREFGNVYVGLSPYELDLWGRLRRSSEAAQARLLASDAAQDAVRQALVADVASTYLQVLQLDQDLAISRRTLASRNKSLELTKSREEGGVASMQDVAQARVLVLAAQATMTDTQRRLEQTENALSILLGRNPGSIKRGSPLTKRPVRTSVPAGLPSSLLENRPDLRAAEQQLIAANADIGQAKAAFFPQLSLTGSYGFQSGSLSQLATSSARTWQFGPAVDVPVFTGGLLKGNLKFAEARFDEALAYYQKSVREAFRDVSDSLIAYRRLGELRGQLEEQVKARAEAAELANVRYEGGVTSYLEVLYNEQELFETELALSRAQLNELLSVVQLYRALGGGWQKRGK
jgi:outer membrane protein, multidrug efflux system